jgi:hypothetical protein
MKKISLLLLGLALVACGCATSGDNANSTANSRPTKPAERNPEVGMTKAQVLELYGKTDNIQASSAGETWVYNLNMGEAFIPFNFGYRPKMRIITFGPDGLVKSWSYTK